MPAQHRLDVWRSERRRLLRELNSDPENDVFLDDLERVETRIRSYENVMPKLEQEQPDAR